MATDQFVPIDVAAGCLGVPVSWLRRQVEPLGIPFLRIGRRRLFDVALIREKLSAAASEAQQGGPAHE